MPVIQSWVINSLDVSYFEHASQSQKTVCYTTQTIRQVQSKQLQRRILKTTKSVTLQPFPSAFVHGFIKIKGHGMKLNLITEPIAHSQIPNFCAVYPSCCKPNPESSRITVRLKNVSAKKIMILAKAVIFQVQLADMVPKLCIPVGQMSTEANQEEDGSQILE